MNKYEKFRAENPVFVYRSYTINETEDQIEISYSFSIPELADFSPSWVFAKPEGVSVKNDLTFERMAFSLGMAEAVSYWSISDKLPKTTAVFATYASTSAKLKRQC